MASSLFGKMNNQTTYSQQGNQQNKISPFQMISAINGVMKGKNPDDVANSLAKVNPQFANFMKENQGKSVEDICRKYGREDLISLVNSSK